MKEKNVLGLCIGLGSYILGSITMVTIVFFAFMIIDFFTGVIGSRASGEKYDKHKAEMGVWKKVGYISLWVMSVLVQIVIHEQGSVIGIDVKIPFVSLLVTFWLLGTEGLSIINNLYKMGVKNIPKRFTDYFEKMKNVSTDEKEED